MKALSATVFYVEPNLVDMRYMCSEDTFQSQQTNSLFPQPNGVLVEYRD